MKKVIIITTWIFVTSIINCYSQEYEYQDKTIIGVFDVNKKNKTEIFNSISKWIALNYNSAMDVVQLKNAESGVIVVKGINESTFKNARKEFYKDEYQNELGIIKFNHTMEINVKDNKFRIIYTLTDAYTPNGFNDINANAEVMLGFDMVEFTGLKQEKVDRFNSWVEEIWKIAWISKKKRKKFKTITRPFYEGVIKGVKLGIKSTMASIYKNVISKKKDDW
tara:strand:+ start:768 stop:1433 length:666 start_codon:yes stop_codon:yes gene_type:complete